MLKQKSTIDGSNFEVFAFIPARGGSKGLHRKNIRTLGDKPLIAYTIEAALASDQVDRVLVSTEDEEIAEIALAAGAEVPFLRPERLAGDTVNLQQVLFHLIDTLIETEGYSPDIYVTLLPTFPFISSASIDTVVRKCRTGSFSAFTVAPWKRKMELLHTVENGALVPLLAFEGEPYPDTSQEMIFLSKTAASAVHVLPKGCRPMDDYDAFVAYIEQLKAQGIMTTSQQGHLLESEIELLDVDTPADLALAQKVLDKQLWRPNPKPECRPRTMPRA